MGQVSHELIFLRKISRKGVSVFPSPSTPIFGSSFTITQIRMMQLPAGQFCKQQEGKVSISGGGEKVWLGCLPRTVVHPALNKTGYKESTLEDFTGSVLLRIPFSRPVACKLLQAMLAFTRLGLSRAWIKQGLLQGAAGCRVH